MIENLEPVCSKKTIKLTSELFGGVIQVSGRRFHHTTVINQPVERAQLHLRRESSPTVTPEDRELTDSYTRE